MYFLGIDIGSSSTDVVLMDRNKQIVEYEICDTEFDYSGIAQLQIEKICRKRKIEVNQIKGMISTGYGRKSVENANSNITEISCHAKGIHYLFPDVRTILDIGGQDSKAIQVDDQGNVIGFVMNDKCAAGTGRYLETMARILKLDYTEMGKKSFIAKEKVDISSVCTVFAETEVISKLAQGNRLEDIVCGIHNSVAQKCYSLLQKMDLNGDIALTGGVAKNIGVVHCIEEHLGKKLFIAKEPQITGAIGAAIYAFESWRKNNIGSDKRE